MSRTAGNGYVDNGSIKNDDRCYAYAYGRPAVCIRNEILCIRPAVCRHTEAMHTAGLIPNTGRMQTSVHCCTLWLSRLTARSAFPLSVNLTLQTFDAISLGDILGVRGGGVLETGTRS